MSDYQKFKRIAILMTKTDEDVMWDIENVEKNELWISAFAQGCDYVREVYDKALDKMSLEEETTTRKIL